MAQKPSIPKGTRDFSPAEVAKRNYIIQTIKKHFETFGFMPIETPSFENSETLMGKYGDEGDRLIFKILNSGDFISKVDDVTYSSKNSASLTPKISEKALRYDLTVPFARYVVMHQNEIDFPFKRYQIQPVWRADRPQKGRFREFYQCDADVVGANGLLQEVEFVQLYDAVFTDLGLKGTTIKINNRKILSGIAEVIGAKHLLVDFTVALDKLDKIGEEKVKTEMLEKGISEAAITKAQPLFEMTGTAAEQLEKLKSILAESEAGMHGVAELEEIITTVDVLGLQSAKLQLDVTLARGLNYYTGAIFEVAAPEGVQMGSIGGGGRYDDLTGIFGLKDVSGVGISFGLDRIYLVLEELNLFPDSLDIALDVLCLNFGKQEGLASLKLVSALRKAGLRADLYPTDAKMNKQFKYADKRGVPYTILLGEQELTNGNFVVKNMKTGNQQAYSLDDAASFAESIKSAF
ncbi:histidine--tRNA ligase [Flagellimonas zhangzhouensis]|uniref:Histidine--tRNA ligase n=1 Tax=Flagellimonas zhangzhouensis TaxID=1073328 RepID=A0A1H2RWR2_9FLAO|nr:histidine--tRNA ligase [Allomuricauda zhangzhouensis]SDQ68435.1 histidyl-tRNA synthetase [Allomuricauda zhangzhouensis]SDW23913.1 histidyl-tRNA synthetase [Allomuricauda zhangzhouensis]